MLEHKFMIGEEVMWDEQIGIQTGVIIETSFDPLSLRTACLIKLPNNSYVKRYDDEIRRVEK